MTLDFTLKDKNRLFVEIIPEKISGRDILAQRKAQNSNGHASDNEEAEAKSEEEEEEEDGS